MEIKKRYYRHKKKHFCLVLIKKYLCQNGIYISFNVDRSFAIKMVCSNCKFVKVSNSFGEFESIEEAANPKYNLYKTK